MPGEIGRSTAITACARPDISQSPGNSDSAARRTMAPPISLDLRFRIIPPDRNIFLVFPGEGYFLFDSFVARQRIFPELPALDLVPGLPIDEQPDLEAKVARSRRINAWYASGQRNDLPSRQLADYRNTRRTRRLSQIIGVLSGFFSRAAKGDVVLVPGANVFEKVLIGELLDGPTEFTDITVEEHWGREKVPSRRVRWLASPQRGELSLALQQRLPSPNAFRTLPPEDLEERDEIFSLAYGSYSVGDNFTSKFNVTSAEFSTRDDYYLQQIFNVVASICQQIDEHVENAPALDTKQLDEIIDFTRAKRRPQSVQQRLSSQRERTSRVARNPRARRLQAQSKPGKPKFRLSRRSEIWYGPDRSRRRAINA